MPPKQPQVAEENKLKSVVLPAISTGIFGFPLDRCDKIMLTTTIEYLSGKLILNKWSFAFLEKRVSKHFLMS